MATDYQYLIGEAKAAIAQQLLNMTENNPPITPTKPPQNPCSMQYCENGHNWAPQLALPHCQGCQNPLVALKMVNCPVCNEPVTRTILRIDHLGGAHPITKPCKKEYHVGPEYILVEINHKHNTWIATSQSKTDSSGQSISVGVSRLEDAGEESIPTIGYSELDGCVSPV